MSEHQEKYIFVLFKPFLAICIMFLLLCYVNILSIQDRPLFQNMYPCILHGIMRFLCKITLSVVKL